MDEVRISRFETDVLVLGGGAAGYRAAMAARKCGVAVTMAYFARGASPYILGCNAPIASEDARDRADVYFEDTIRGGYGLNDRGLVRVLADQAAEAQRELADIGVPFARRQGRTAQRHLSGNTFPRSVYVADGTGRACLDHLRRHATQIGVDELAGFKVVELIRDGDEVAGALLWDRRQASFVVASARAVVLAMGGIGRLYTDSTYPADVGSDSYGVALNAGARLVDMEFVQFEPVVTVWPDACKGMEMPTAMLGDGAHLLNVHGERFMFRHNPEHGERQIEKARMALCIQAEIDNGRGLPDGTVAFDATVLPKETLETYVTHVKRLRAAGVDPAQVAPHVRPAAHSQMGGVHIDATCFSGVPGLYVGGEASGGVHGASRIAGNGASDAVVFGAVAGRAAADRMHASNSRDWPALTRKALAPLRELSARRGSLIPEELKDRVRDVMRTAAGLWRHGTALAEGRDRLKALERAVVVDVRIEGMDAVVDTIELTHMLATARVIVEAALLRTESRGAHQRRDWPRQDDANWLKHIGYCRRGGDIICEHVAIR